MFKKLLVPLDGSELAEVALPYAQMLAGELGSKIVLLQVWQSREEKADHTRRIYMRRLAEIVKEKTQDYRKLSGYPDGDEIEVESVIMTGNPSDEIINYSEAENISFIIMATHGYSGIKRWALGSVARNILKGTHVPIVLIRAGGTDPMVRGKGVLTRVLLPLDGSDEGEAAVPYMEELATKIGTELTLLQIVEAKYTTSNAALLGYGSHQIEESARTYLAGVEEKLLLIGALESNQRVLESGEVAGEVVLQSPPFDESSEPHLDAPQIFGFEVRVEASLARRSVRELLGRRRLIGGGEVSVDVEPVRCCVGDAHRRAERVQGPAAGLVAVAQVVVARAKFVVVVSNPGRHLPAKARHQADLGKRSE